MMGLYPPLISTVAKNGGVVLGAFDDKTGQMVAFLFGFLGREPGGPLKLCSQNMGVRPEWRRQGVAEALKQAQRERVLAQGLPLITWTYDPLEGPNAHLNLHKLRAISRRYIQNLYGMNFGALNAGLPSDRLLVEWWVRGPRLERPAKPAGEGAASIFQIEGEGVRRQVVGSDLALEGDVILLETPADLHALKAADMALATDWRLKVREAFETYFEKGYIAIDFVSTFKDGERCNRYVLQKSTPELLREIGIEV
jgi:predicted GNAT superfamily acetyltransferase